MMVILLLITILLVVRRSVGILAGFSHPGSLDHFEPDIQCRSHLFADSPDQVMGAFRTAIATHPRMRMADQRAGEMLIDLRPPITAQRNGGAFTFRLRFSDVGCGTEMSSAYRRKVRWSRRDERLLARTEPEIRALVKRMGLTEVI